MPTLEFTAEHVYPDHPTRGIVLSVELRAINSLRLHAHLDTGAANCLFQGEYAEVLGLNLTDGIPQRFSLADGGSINAYGHPVAIRVLDHTVDSIAYFVDNPNFARNVLGRQGWMNHFKLGLIEYERKFYLGYLGN